MAPQFSCLLSLSGSNPRAGLLPSNVNPFSCSTNKANMMISEANPPKYPRPQPAPDSFPSLSGFSRLGIIALVKTVEKSAAINAIVYANNTQNVFSRFGSANHKEKVEITKRKKKHNPGFSFLSLISYRAQNWRKYSYDYSRNCNSHSNQCLAFDRIIYHSLHKIWTKYESGNQSMNRLACPIK